MDIINLAEETENFTGNVWKTGNSLIDVGTGDVWKKIKELEEVKEVVITHSHYDHVDNLRKVKEKYQPKVYAFEPSNLEIEAEKIQEGQNIEINGIDFRVIHTPGHKDDSVCLYSEKEKILFTGDLIFPEGGFGRTDLLEGNRDKLIQSIEKITQLDVKEFYPGHELSVKNKANQQIQESLKEAKKNQSKY